MRLMPRSRFRSRSPPPPPPPGALSNRLCIDERRMLWPSGMATLQNCNIGCALRAARCAARAPAARNVASPLRHVLLHVASARCRLYVALLHVAFRLGSTLHAARSSVAGLQEQVDWYVRHNIVYDEAKVEAALDKLKGKQGKVWNARTHARTRTYPPKPLHTEPHVHAQLDILQRRHPPRPFLPPSRPPEPHLAPRAQTPACPPTRPRARSFARTRTHTCTRARMCTGTRTRTRLGTKPLLAGSLRWDSEGLGPRPRALSCGYFEVL
jgi:hypothetical protein